MMHSMIIVAEILLIVVLILLNGYFAMSEIALLSARKSRLRQKAREGDANAAMALALVRKSPEVLSTIQIGITIIGIAAGAFGGATIAEKLGTSLNRFPLLAGYGEAIGVIIVITVITYCSLVVGELVPKQIALSKPEKIARRVARPIRFLLTVFSPIVFLLSRSTRVILRLLRVTPVVEPTVTAEEIALLIAEGIEHGVFEKAEKKMVERIFQLGNRPIGDVMTPRAEVVWLDLSDSFAVIAKKIAAHDRSVFPVCDGDLDRTVGVAETRDVLLKGIGDDPKSITLQTLVQPVIELDRALPALVAIERLKQSALDFAVIREQGSTRVVGIVTLHDILEAIVGQFQTPAS
jgi:putative hemolysin